MANADTENKRRSAVCCIPHVVYPLADGTIGAADREQVAYIYSGIAVSGAPVITVNRSRDLLLMISPEIIPWL